MTLKESKKEIEIRKIKKEIEKAEEIATQIGITGKKSGMTIDAILCTTGKHKCDLQKLSGFYGQEKFIKELERVRLELLKKKKK